MPIKAPDGSGGKQIKCPRCGKQVRVPGAKPKRARTSQKAAPADRPSETKKAAKPAKAAPEPSEDKRPAQPKRPEGDAPTVVAAEPDVTVGETSESAVEPHDYELGDTAAVSGDEAHDAADDATVVDRPGADAAADTREAASHEPASRADRSDPNTEAESVDEYQVAAPAPVTRAVPVSFSVSQPKQQLPLSSPGSDYSDAPSPFLRAGPAPRFTRLQLCAWLLWAMAVLSIIVAVGLAIWYPISMTNDDFVNRRLMLLCGVGAAAVFWVAAELAYAARRFFRDGYR